MSDKRVKVSIQEVNWGIFFTWPGSASIRREGSFKGSFVVRLVYRFRVPGKEGSCSVYGVVKAEMQK